MRKTYLDVLYPEIECSEKQYPQKLCNYISKTYFSKPSGACGKLLDVGCGRGNHLVGFQRCGYEVYGLDKTREMFEALKGFTIKQCDVEKDAFPYQDNMFDWVWCKSLLELVPNTDHLIQEILRVLKPRAKVVFLTPDARSQHIVLFDDYTYKRLFSRKGLQNAMIVNGFENIRASIFWQLPFVWKYPYLGFIPKIISLLPESLKWRDFEETKHRKLIRFSKEKMILGVGEKPGR